MEPHVPPPPLPPSLLRTPRVLERRGHRAARRSRVKVPVDWAPRWAPEPEHYPQSTPRGAQGRTEGGPSTHRGLVGRPPGSCIWPFHCIYGFLNLCPLPLTENRPEMALQSHGSAQRQAARKRRCRRAKDRKYGARSLCLQPGLWLHSERRCTALSAGWWRQIHEPRWEAVADTYWTYLSSRSGF